MTKKELSAVVAEKTGLTKKDSEAVLTAILEAITDELAGGGDVYLTGFGTFSLRSRAAHRGKNPATGEVITVPASVIPGFRAGKALKDAVTK